MGRFRGAGDEPVPYSELHPERFELPPVTAREIEADRRALDEAPISAPRQREARLGYQHLKRSA